jgi:hypothetical protein
VNDKVKQNSKKFDEWLNKQRISMDCAICGRHEDRSPTQQTDWLVGEDYDDPPPRPIYWFCPACQADDDVHKWYMERWRRKHR